MFVIRGFSEYKGLSFGRKIYNFLSLCNPCTKNKLYINVVFSFVNIINFFNCTINTTKNCFLLRQHCIQSQKSHVFFVV